ncbi:MAG: FtsX-like permease family protein [Saprospiraceae bacterium]
MNFPFFVARKVAAAGGQSFSRMIIRIAIIAVAVSMTVMVVSSALIAGFKKEIAEKIFGFWGHIHITDHNISRSITEVYPVSIDQPFYPELAEVASITFPVEDQLLGRRVVKDLTTKGGIRHIQAYALYSGIIRANDELEGIMLKGIGQDFDWEYLNKYLLSGQPLTLPKDAMDDGILISRYTADRLKVEVGDKFSIFFVTKEFEQLERKFRVQGIYRTGLEEYDRQFALVDLRKIQQILNWDATLVSGFEVFLDDIDDLDAFTNYIYYQELPSGLYAESIREKMHAIFEWLDLQDVNEWVIMGLMLLVAVINMVTALLILILERTNMIGTLKSLGASNWSIRKIFIYYAAWIVVVGLFWGNVLGLGLCWLQDTFSIITLDEANYYLSVAPIRVNGWTVLLLNVGTLVITLLFLILPSYWVARIDPVKAIRFK